MLGENCSIKTILFSISTLWVAQEASRKKKSHQVFLHLSPAGHHFLFCSVIDQLGKFPSTLVFMTLLQSTTLQCKQSFFELCTNKSIKRSCTKPEKFISLIFTSISLALYYTSTVSCLYLEDPVEAIQRRITHDKSGHVSLLNVVFDTERFVAE